MRALAASALAIILAGCATAPPPPADPHRIGLQEGEDTCGARNHAALLGHPVSQAPQPSANRSIRVVGDGDPVTMDFSPQRLNIYYDKRTGLIVGIKCG